MQSRGPEGGGVSGLAAALRDPITLGIIGGLVLDATLRWIDVFGVSLLIGDLAYGADTLRDDHVKVGVLTGSLTAAALATLVLRRRNRYYRVLNQQQSADHDRDGVPDIYQSPSD